MHFLCEKNCFDKSRMCPARGPGHSMGPGNEKEDPEEEDSNSKNDPKENKEDPNKKKTKFPGSDIIINEGKIYFPTMKCFFTFQIFFRSED